MQIEEHMAQGELNKGKNVIFYNRTFLPTRPNPDKFIPERFFPGNDPSLDAFYPFSAGANNCIGKNVAWITMNVALVALLRKFELPECEQD